MLRRLLLTVVVVMGMAAGALAQEASEGGFAWRRAGNAAPPSASAASRADDSSPLRNGSSGDTAAAPAVVPAAAAIGTPTSARPFAPVSNGSGTLPNDAGQLWREYDISGYTARVTSTRRPEQAIVDWILRATGYEAWHTEPLGLLSAGPRTLRVYHTPAMQAVVADLVDRFVSSEAATSTFSLRVVTLDNPGWRTSAQRLLRPVPVQTPGINAWLLAKEDAAILLGELRRRSDYREHSSPYLMVNNGQSTLVSAMRGRPFIRDVIARPDTPQGFDPSPGQVDEGFKLDFSPLLTLDRRMVDATIKCDIDQIEKMIPVMIDVPAPNSSGQRTKIEVPQITHYRFHEQFHWPVEHVLVVGLGMVALPIPVDGAPLLPGIPLGIGATPARADLLILVECKGQSAGVTAGSPQSPRTPQREAKNYRGRY